MRKGVGKRILTAALALVTFLTSVPLSANAETYVVAGANYDTADATKLDNEFATAYLFDDGMLYVDSFKQSGDTSNYPWYNHKDEIKSLSFGGNVTVIEDNAFKNYSGITGGLSFNSGVTRIGDYAFYNCIGLTGGLSTPNTVTEIGELAFAHDSGFTSLSLGFNSETTINGSFYDCTGLTGEIELTSYKNVLNTVDVNGQKIGAFQGCTGISSVKTQNGTAFYGQNDTMISDEYTFKDCTGIPKVTITFDANGGQFEDGSTQVVKQFNFAELIEVPECDKENNTIHHYHYVGPTGANVSIPIDEISGYKAKDDITIYMDWTPAYTIKFDSHGGTVIPDSKVESGSKLSQPSCSKEGYDLDGWYTDYTNYGSWESYSNKWDFSKRYVYSAYTLHAKWVARVYTVSFDTDGGSTVPDQRITHGKTIAEPTKPTKDGYKFAGWYVDPTYSEEFDITTPIKGATQLYAKWDVAKYDVTFNVMGGTSSIDTQVIEYNKTATQPTNPKKSGYNFKGWFTNSSCTNEFDFSTPIKADTTLYAGWTTNKVYKVTFIGYKQNVVKLVEEGKKVARPTEDPVNTDMTFGTPYTFVDWYADAYRRELFDFDTPITYSRAVFAKFDGTFQIQFIIDKKYTGESYETRVIENHPSGDKLVEPSKDKVKPELIEHKEFKGWLIDNVYASSYDNRKVYWDFDNDKVTASFNLIAIYDYKDCIIHYDTKGGSTIANDSVKYGEYIVSRPEDPTKPGYGFKGWYKDAECTQKFDFTTIITEDTTIYAKWEEKNYTVSFDWLDVPSQTISENNKVTKPATDPEYPHKDFVGWYKDAEGTWPWDFDNDVVTSDMTLYPKFEDSVYTVTFDVNGGAFEDGSTYVAPQTVTWEQHLTKPAKEPKKDGYKFAAWTADINNSILVPWNFPYYHVEHDMVLYARYFKVYIVKFETDGGSAIADQELVEKSGMTCKATKPSNPTKSGYKFIGWYTDDTFTTEYEFSDQVTSDITLYAKWEVSNEPVNPAPSKKPDPEPEKPTPSDDPTPDKTPEPTVEPEKEQEVIIPTPTPTPTPTPAIEVIPENTDKPDPEPETKEPEPVVEEITEPEEVEEPEEVVEYTPEIKPIVNEEEPLLIGSVDSDKVNEKGALGRWLEEHKVMVIVVSISIITVLIGLFILLLLLAWIKRVIVQNDKNTDDYSDENFETVYRTSVKSEGNIFDEVFKKSEVKVWTLKIPENIINERTTDQFKVVLNKHFCKRNNGGDLIIVINSNNEEERQDLKFVIDEEENEIRFTYEESK